MFVIELDARSPGILYRLSEISLVPEILQQGKDLNFKMEVDISMLNGGDLQLS